MAQNHDARKAVSVSLSVLKWSWAIVRPRSSKVRLQKVLLCPFHLKPRPSGVSLESPGLENIFQVPKNRAEVDHNHHARNGFSAILSVLNLSRAIFLPWSSKVSVQNVFLCSLNWKPRSLGVSLASPRFEIIRQLPGNREKVAQTHDARKVVSATLSVLKLRGAIFRPRSSRPGVR